MITALVQATLLVCFLGACTVDEGVLEGLPCECADGFVCDEASNRCFREGELPDSGTDTADVSVDGADTDVGDAGADAADADAASDATADVSDDVMDAADTDATDGDAAPDTGPGRDEDLGDCLLGPSDDFSGPTIDSARWRIQAGGGATVQIEDGGLVTRYAADSMNEFAFLRAVRPMDLSECAVVVEFAEPELRDGASNFFSYRREDDNANSFGFELPRSDRRLIAQFVNDASDAGMPTVQRGVDYDPVAHRWLGLRASGTDVVWLVSRDGADWVEFARTTAPFDLADGEYILGGGVFRNFTEAVEARLDNFNLPTR